MGLNSTVLTLEKLPVKHTQLFSPFEVLDTLFAGIIKKRRPISKAAVESVAKPLYLERD